MSQVREIPLPPRESPRLEQSNAHLRAVLDKRDEQLQQDQSNPELAKAWKKIFFFFFLFRFNQTNCLKQPLIKNSFYQRTTQREVFEALRNSSEADFDQLLDAFAASKTLAEQEVYYIDVQTPFFLLSFFLSSSLEYSRLGVSANGLLLVLVLLELFFLLRLFLSAGDIEGVQATSQSQRGGVEWD